jgi:isocitrate dehydrogenase
MAKIVYTHTDEAPMLATYSFLPIIQAFVKSSNVDVELSDISVAGRVIANFPENLTKEQKIPDELAILGKLTLEPQCNIIKLPNISASIPQLKECISELQSHGYKVPNYPEDPKTQAEKDIQEKYKKILGSAVNPVLREGNSDRRAAKSVKEYAQKHPHRMGKWQPNSVTHVASMTKGDFFGNEKSFTAKEACTVKIEHIPDGGAAKVLKEVKLKEGEVCDASCLNVQELRAYFEREMQDAKAKDTLLSLHLKATMMKVSDPIIFGHAVHVYFKDVFAKYDAEFKALGVNPNLGLGDLYKKIANHPKKAEIEAAIEETFKKRPRLAMVNAAKKITNLHVSSDVIIDASMPPMIRDGGIMWNAEDKPEATKAMIPDRSYASVFQTVIDFCKQNGNFNVSTMGTVPNVGLMAQKAEEYGSHDKTFEIPSDGLVRVTHSSGATLFEHKVGKGDIWRMCQTKDIPIKDWVKLAVTRARLSNTPAIFWLDENRAHDAELIKKVHQYLKLHDTKGLDILIMSPQKACLESIRRAKEGKDTISVTGNVLRDYNTDLFPILELNTSAKMLSIVPMIAGGGMYETGAGGSAPKHVEQFVEEGHLRWDSLGEFLALEPSLMDIGINNKNEKAKVLSETLGSAIGTFLDENKSPSRKKMEIDNRGSHFYLALYWAEALAAQTKDASLKSQFGPVAKKLRDNVDKINQELIECQGKALDIGGYYHPDPKKLNSAMRPSALFNGILTELSGTSLEVSLQKGERAGDLAAGTTECSCFGFMSLFRK